MKFRSTRGGCSGTTFEEAIARGYAPDGGLFVPEVLPKIDAARLREWRALDFCGLAERVLGLFVSEEEVSPDELSQIVAGSYAGFACPEVVPVPRVGNLHVAELFHGPTFCFKDLGQQPLVRLLAHFAERRGERRTMLVATTGDTGPAAMRAVSDAGSSSVSIVVFYPEGQISELQRRQMTTCSSASARVASFEGGGDDMDAPLKNLASDRAFATRHGLVGANSYNIGRPVAQMVHYFWTYFRVLDERSLDVGAPVDFALPAGALGNLAAGYMSRCMGLPIRRITVGVNANDITHRTVAYGEFHRSEQMEKTLSDAINIQVPYNMERVLFYLTGEDTAQVATWMAEMERSGRLTLPQVWLAKLREVLGSARVDDELMCWTLRRALEDHGYLADPHTAVALAAAWDAEATQRSADAEAQGSEPPLAVLATAHPCKFEASVTVAIDAKRWKSYAGSAVFPEAARALLAASERPYQKLQAGVSLQASQEAWEAEVRRMLDGAGVAAAGSFRAKL